MVERDAFAEARAVLDGLRVPFEGVTSKILMPMLRDTYGADLAMTPRRCTFDSGEGPGGALVLSCIPSVLSFFLDELRITAPVVAHAGVIPAGAVPDTPPLSGWPYGPRAVWIAGSAERITIVVRDGRVPEILDTRPQPIVVEEWLAATWPCPHCNVVPERYRGPGPRVICQACGASSPIPAR